MENEIYCKSLLAKKNMRATKNRMKILNCLMEEGLPMTADDIYDCFEDKEKVPLSTIYRTLATLFDKGLLIREVQSDGKAYYQLESPQHKHIVRCIVCNKVKSIDYCPVEEIENSIEEETGYKLTGHHLEFVGLCPECQKKSKE